MAHQKRGSRQDNRADASDGQEVDTHRETPFVGDTLNAGNLIDNLPGGRSLRPAAVRAGRQPAEQADRGYCYRQDSHCLFHSFANFLTHIRVR